MKCELNALGHEVLMLDADATRYGAVETPQEGEVFANFLRANRGKFGGVIVCLPNFGDETGAVARCRKPGADLIRLTRMITTNGPGLAARCFLRQDLDHGRVPPVRGEVHRVMKPHTVRPGTERFKANIDEFDRVCRVVKGVKGMVVGAIGARTTPFKTVRIDEVTLQRHGITVETFDLSDIFHRMKAVKPLRAGLQDKAAVLQQSPPGTACPKGL